MLLAYLCADISLPFFGLVVSMRLLLLHEFFVDLVDVIELVSIY